MLGLTALSLGVIGGVCSFFIIETPLAFQCGQPAIGFFQIVVHEAFGPVGDLSLIVDLELFHFGMSPVCSLGAVFQMGEVDSDGFLFDVSMLINQLYYLYLRFQLI